MRRLLTLALGLHWMSVFTMLAAACVAEPRAGFAGPLGLLGADTRELVPAGGTEASAFFAIVFAFAAVLFLFAVLDLVAGRSRRRHVAHLHWAFGAGVFGQTLLLGVGALAAVPGVFVTLECMLAATLASYVAIHVELRTTSRPAARPDASRNAARVMALGAAHTSLLQRFPAAVTADMPERRP